MIDINVSHIVGSSGYRKFLLEYVNKNDSSLFLFSPSGGSSFIGAIDDEKNTHFLYYLNTMYTGHEFRSENLK